jgi:dephospho-CoA kinase
LVVAGLTGGIATGKSTVASFLESFGAVVLDADKIAREVVEKGTPAWHRIREHFGSEVFLEDGTIDRESLGSIIFGDQKKKELLNSLVHPAVFEEMAKRLGELQSKADDTVVICDVPLLIETEMYRDFSEVILAYVPEELQLERLMTRDRISREEALKKVCSQMRIEEKRKYATIIIDNSGSIEKTSERTLEVYRYLKGKAEGCVKPMPR